MTLNLTKFERPSALEALEQFEQEHRHRVGYKEACSFLRGLIERFKSHEQTHAAEILYANEQQKQLQKVIEREGEFVNTTHEVHQKAQHRLRLALDALDDGQPAQVRHQILLASAILSGGAK